MASALVRQWLVLTMIPKVPPRIDAAGIVTKLKERGIDVHRRTVQRDLVELSRVFPLVADQREKPFGWRWADGAEFLCSIPLMTDTRPDSTLITLVLRVDRGMVRVVCEGLRGREGDAREVAVSPIRPDGSVEITAKVPDSCALRRWILGFGEGIEVLAPAHVRGDFIERAVRMASLYGLAAR